MEEKVLYKIHITGHVQGVGCKKGPGYVESVTADPYPPVNYKEFRVEH